LLARRSGFNRADRFAVYTLKMVLLVDQVDRRFIPRTVISSKEFLDKPLGV
jgi:hypothetical protein